MEKQHLILVIDDDLINLKRAQGILGGSYRIASAKTGMQALSYLEKNTPRLILLDINMPGMDGFEIFRRIRAMKDERKKRIPVIFLTVDTDAETETKCFEAGAADFVGKPFVAKVLISRVRRALEMELYHLHLEEMVQEQAKTITRIQDDIITGLANIIECRDGSTGMHVKKTQKYVELLTHETRRRGLFPEILTPEYETNTIKAAVLHDVGKIKISDAILQKPVRLDEKEYAQMKRHSIYGGEIVEQIIADVEDPVYIKIAKEIARFHHERYDGAGYPDGLSGTDIPLCARIMALADVYDALASERCYKKPIRPLSKVFDIIREGAGTQFDPVLTEVFLSLRPEIEQVMRENGEEIDE